MQLLTLTPTTELVNVRLSLEVQELEFKSSEKQKEPFTLDLWKGFSKEIALNLSTIEEVPEVAYGPNFWFPHEVQQDFERIHLARSLSHGLLVIKDASGQTVPFDHTADNDTWDMGVWVNDYPHMFRGQTYHGLFTYPTASLLQQFRNKLHSGTNYSLQLGAKSTKMSWAEEDWTDEALISHLQRVEGPQQAISCDEKPIHFQVRAGKEVPRFCISMSTTSSIYSLSSGTSFEVSLEVTSLARTPIMLGLKTSGYYGWSISTPLTRAGSTGIAVFFLKPFDDLGYDATYPEGVFLNTNGDGWLWNELEYWLWHERTPSSVEMIAGNYRQNLDDVSTYIKPRHCLAPTVPSHASLSLKPGPELPQEALIMCPGDRLRYNFPVDTNDMVFFNNGGRFRLSLKNHFCNFWKEISDAEVRNSPVRVCAPASWPSCGPIYLETVSEVAHTLECIFEREKPQPFYRLPRELREQVFEYLRYKVRAKYVDFMVRS